MVLQYQSYTVHVVVQLAWVAGAKGGEEVRRREGVGEIRKKKGRVEDKECLQ